MKNIEIEIRIKIENPTLFKQWLQKEKDTKKIGVFDQTDFYFDPPGKSFVFTDSDGYKDADKWFRVRITKDKSTICYKHWHRDEKTNKSTYADEIETSIGDADKVIEILKRMGFKQIALVEKHRESWEYNEFRFDCDDVEGLGFFVEIEFNGKIEDPTKGKEKIFNLLKEIGLQNWKKIKGGYPWMQWNKDKDYFEEL